MDKTVLLYSGTLGLKHNPQILLRLAERYRERTDVMVVVISEGLGADWLREHGPHLPNLKLLPFQPYHLLSDVFGAADILLVILEAGAGVFSVPSKVLSYLCAGRPMLASLPAENLAARIIERNDSGVVTQPDDLEGWLRACDALLTNPSKREKLGENARRYAEQAFDIGRIGDRFEAVLTSTVPGNAIRQDSLVTQGR